MSKFTHGQQVRGIHFINEQTSCFRAGDNCDSIIVVMENGQMSVANRHGTKALEEMT